MNDQLMKTNASNLKKSSVDEVLSKLLDNNLVSNKKILAVLDSWQKKLELIKYISVFQIVIKIRQNI